MFGGLWIGDLMADEELGSTCMHGMYQLKDLRLQTLPSILPAAA